MTGLGIFSREQFLEGLTHTPFQLVSHQPLCESLTHLYTPLPFTPAIDVLPTSICIPTHLALWKMSRIFEDVWTKTCHLPSWNHYLTFEQHAMTIALFDQRCQTWLAAMISDSDCPITLNLIAFTLQLTIQITESRPGSPQIRMMVIALLSGKIWTRGKLVALLTDPKKANWFPIALAAKLLSAVQLDSKLANMVIPPSWLPIEIKGSAWSRSFAILKLFALTTEGLSIPIVFPSFLSYMVMNIRETVDENLVLSNQATCVPMPYMIPTLVSRADVSLMMPTHFMAPTVRSYGTWTRLQPRPYTTPRMVTIGIAERIFTTPFDHEFDTVEAYVAAADPIWGNAFVRRWQRRLKICKSNSNQLHLRPVDTDEDLGYKSEPDKNFEIFL